MESTGLFLTKDLPSAGREALRRYWALQMLVGHWNKMMTEAFCCSVGLQVGR